LAIRDLAGAFGRKMRKLASQVGALRVASRFSTIISSGLPLSMRRPFARFDLAPRSICWDRPPSQKEFTTRLNLRQLLSGETPQVERAWPEREGLRVKEASMRSFVYPSTLNVGTRREFSWSLSGIYRKQSRRDRARRMRSGRRRIAGRAIAGRIADGREIRRRRERRGASG